MSSTPHAHLLVERTVTGRDGGSFREEFHHVWEGFTAKEARRNRLSRLVAAGTAVGKDGHTLLVEHDRGAYLEATRLTFIDCAGCTR